MGFEWHVRDGLYKVTRNGNSPVNYRLPSMVYPGL